MKGIDNITKRLQSIKANVEIMNITKTMDYYNTIGQLELMISVIEKLNEENERILKGVECAVKDLEEGSKVYALLQLKLLLKESTRSVNGEGD